MKKNYWVYENHPNNITTIHVASCAHCNDGKGMAEEKTELNGEWYGTYTREEAEYIANHTNKNTVKWCGNCTDGRNVK